MSWKEPSHNPRHEASSSGGSSRRTGSSSETSRVGNGQLGEFILGSTLLGKGSFSQVKLGQELTTGETVAIKIIDHAKLSVYDLACIKTEVSVLQKLSHRYLVQYLDHFVTEENTFIILEYIPGGNLFQYLKARGGSLSENEARKILSQLLRGIAHCHQQGVAHRDLKLEHVLLDAHGDVRIIDFGLSSAECDAGTLLNTFCGSPLYIAPEIVEQQPYAGDKVDIWALGIIFYVCVCGSFPFFARDKNLLYKCIKSGKFSFPRHADASLSPIVKNLITNMLNRDPAHRLSAAELLLSPFFTNQQQALRPNNRRRPPSAFGHQRFSAFHSPNTPPAYFGSPPTTKTPSPTHRDHPNSAYTVQQQQQQHDNTTDMIDEMSVLQTAAPLPLDDDDDDDNHRGASDSATSTTSSSDFDFDFDQTTYCDYGDYLDETSSSSGHSSGDD
eukprot:CAMPEP_0201553320 /NCGR_PEP_ID=MMETSP0173_2-20130828/24476_1 /ASSEMBLY_ACC=CAM_ASM_000268 /TAXON_ID=218659 /ORGANISM="Vexillifera sp., Strain DIVA3 564/2" /LENGTH=442 /DNA_ID=CAMNT_0047964029 /DNA_START=35 /DNA_END=1363 /DNA_ORIENTATION=-